MQGKIHQGAPALRPHNARKDLAMSSAPFYMARLSGYVSAYAASDGTCLYVRAPNGLEVFNGTAYSDPSITAAQDRVAQHFGINALDTMFVQHAPEKIDMRALVLLATITHIVGCWQDSGQSGSNTSMTIDAEFKETVT